MIPTAHLLQDTAPTFPPLGKKIKALLVWPKIPNSFWAFNGMLDLLPEKVVMPPLGLVTVAALCPSEWTLRLVDEAVEDLTDDDLRWADLVMVGGMEVQKAGMHDILVRARAKTLGQTGVEMEALTAVSVAALTIYDMCKALDKAMRITDIVLVSKTKT